MNLPWFKSESLDIRNKNRILLIHPFGIGDVLFITPLLRALKENGIKQVDLLLGSRTREVFECNPHVDRIYEWDKTPHVDFLDKSKHIKELAALFTALWRNHYDVVIDFTPRSEYAFLSWLFFWIPIRIGFNYKGRGIFLTHKQELSDGFSEKPISEYYNNLLKFLGLRVTDKRAELFLEDKDQSEAQAILKQIELKGNRSYAVVSLGGGESWGRDARLKRWPVKNFSGLLAELRKNYPSLFDAVLVLGTREERLLCSELISGLIDIPVYDLCGTTSIRCAAALIEKALFFIGNDGGLVHIAHSLKTPLVALYGPVDPIVYGPHPADSNALAVTSEGPACRPCYQRFRYQDACKGVECLTHLTVDQVLKRMESSRFIGYLNDVLISK